MSTLLHGDCREVMPAHGPYDMILADPPYGDTSLAWDRHVAGWEAVAHAAMKPTGSMWVFGSMRFFMTTAARFEAAGWRYAQDVVWEKHNGSGLRTDRFKRVHEIATQFYRADAPWCGVWNEVQTTADATARRITRNQKPPHLSGNERGTSYATEHGGPRIMRSVIPMHSCHGHAIHPTEKPVGLLRILISTSCPPGGLVGDFFAGSGACGEACGQSGRRYVGAEIDPAMAAAAQDRLRGGLFTQVAAE